MHYQIGHPAPRMSNITLVCNCCLHVQSDEVIYLYRLHEFSNQYRSRKDRYCCQCKYMELMDKFCYLGDMLSVDGDADAVVETRIRIRWSKFNKDISLIVRWRLYSSCVQSSMLHGSETWPVRKENVVALQQAEMRMVRWMCDVKVKDKSSKLS